MTAKQKILLSAENYLKQERQAEFKSEYYNGEIYAMAGASRNHNQITSNLIVSLGTQLAKLPCSVYSSDMKVRTNVADTSKYSYPDVVLRNVHEITWLLWRRIFVSDWRLAGGA